jgi:hypothetical protein
MVQTFEAALIRSQKASSPAAPPLPPGAPAEHRTATWQDAIRALELDDGARRSVERRRASPMEYPEASEEVGFKGTMTLIGCAIVWGILLLLILSSIWPAARWVIVPLVVVFLALQLLRYLIPGPRS